MFYNSQTKQSSSFLTIWTLPTAVQSASGQTWPTAEKVALQPRANGAIFTGWTPLVVRDGGHRAHLATEDR